MSFVVDGAREDAASFCIALRFCIALVARDARTQPAPKQIFSFLIKTFPATSAALPWTPWIWCWCLGGEREPTMRKLHFGFSRADDDADADDRRLYGLNADKYLCSHNCAHEHGVCVARSGCWHGRRKTQNMLPQAVWNVLRSAICVLRKESRFRAVASCWSCHFSGSRVCICVWQTLTVRHHGAADRCHF